MKNVNFDGAFSFKTDRTQMAKNIAKILDANDGKKDSRISASVWNEFVKDKGGKTIKHSISVENARKPISTYLDRISKETGRSKADLEAEWFLKMAGTSQKPKLSLEDMLRKSEAQKRNNPEAIKASADHVTKFVTGRGGETVPQSYPDTAAKVFDKVSKNFNGKIPTTLGTSLYLMGLYPALLKRAQQLGIDTNYNKNTDFGENMLDACKNKLTACTELKNQILAAEKSQSKN